MTGLTRRDFLENSMFATAAAAAMNVALPQPSYGIERVGPNDKLRVAILGVNGRGRSHIGGFVANPHCDIVALCDPDESVGLDRVKMVGEKQGTKPKYVRELRTVMEDPNIDIVTSGGSPAPVRMRTVSAMAESSGVTAPTLEPGVQLVTVNVSGTIELELKQ